MKKLLSGKEMTVLVLVAVLAVAAVGLSYAYFTVQVEGGDLFTIFGSAKNDTPSITLTESTTGVTLSGTYPMPDALGLQGEAYSFTVTNDETSKSVNIKIVLEVSTDSTLSDTLVRYALDNNVGSLGTTTTTSSDAFKSAYVLAEETLDAGASTSHELKVWIEENATVADAQGKTWTSKIMVIPEFTE